MAKAPAKTTLYKGKSLPKGEISKIRKKPGMGSAGKYKSLPKKAFAGPEGTFPINTTARARNALARAHYAKNPEAIKQKVYSKYPVLKNIMKKKPKGKL